MRFKRTYKRKTLYEELLKAEEIIQTWALKFCDKKRKRKYIGKKDQYILTSLMDIWNWVKELREIVDETPLKTAVEETAYLFKSDDEELSAEE